MAKTAFITGATGIVGSRLIAALTKANWEVVALARPHPKYSSSQRLLRALYQVQGGAVLDKTEVVEGDVCRPLCGLSSDTISRLKGRCQVFWHCAGDTRFATRLRKEIHSTNLSGTANALATAQALEIEDFCHISTAFVFGDYAGIGSEQPHPELNQAFNNPYEESKFLAERLVTASTVNWIIFRPPIVVGDAKNGAVNGFSGYYGFMREFWRFKDRVLNGMERESGLMHQAGIQMLDNWLYLPINVPGRETSLLTISSVDFVVDAMVGLAELPYCYRKVYHIVPAKSRTYGWWLDTSLKVLGIKGVRIVNPSQLVADQNQGRYFSIVQRRIIQGCKPYMPYICGNTTFEPSNLARVLPLCVHQPIDEQFVSTLLKYAILSRFGQT